MNVTTGSIWPDRGVAHKWVRRPNGRWSTVCRTETDRWSKPYERPDAEPCSNCDVERRIVPETEKALRSFLGYRWPRSYTLSEIRAASPELVGRARTLAALGNLVDAGLVFVYESDGRTARKRWVAGRRLVESVGRTYGMIGR